MANPARVPDPRLDPLNTAPMPGIDPLVTDSRAAANDPRTADPRIVNRVETRSGGSGVMIAAVVLVLAVVAYFVFAPASETVAPADPAVTTEPAAPAPAEPAATAPAAPEAVAPAAPDAMAPAEPAAPNTMAPADPAAPAAPAAPAPAQ